MVYGESRKDNKVNSNNRCFGLGPEAFSERNSYDQFGVKNCLFDDDYLKVEEKISEGCKTLNAATGIGIRKNGISMMAGNIIFCAVVVPIVTFGSKLWVLSDKVIENLLNFERFAGRHIQRFPPRTPNSSSFYVLGWSKLKTFIGVKKVLFAMTIIHLGVENVIRTIFARRLDDLLRNIQEAERNAQKSPFMKMLTLVLSSAP